MQSLERGAIFAGRYVVEQLLGEGGSGAVFAAHDPDTGAAVAIKVLRPELAEDEQAKQAAANPTTDSTNRSTLRTLSQDRGS